ncbi:MAG: DegV family EDD domain-containing protein [Lentimicrobiaceae bacterium]|nr:DegV family EDD domain-containing protein [Lentimicrobiaceae bacterium]
MNNTISEINGVQLYNSFIAGAQKIFENQVLLNNINFYPVPDADTGTNLASTMYSIVNTVKPTKNIKETALALADAALVGARGNSGIIFAQFLYGFSKDIKGQETMNLKEFSENMHIASECAYYALAKPKEGTMISVIRDWAVFLCENYDTTDDITTLLLNALTVAMESLKGTGKFIAAKAKTIVDAGAKGFVVFLEGMCEYFHSGEKTVQVANAEIIDSEWLGEDNHEDITFRYCTEALLIGENLEREKLSSMIESMGDCLVIAGSNKKMRLHIHTDEPWIVLEKVQMIGRVVYQKVEDMVMQHDLVANRKSKIGILSDSSCDIPKNLLEKYQIQTIPLTVSFGDEFYLDQLTIKPKQFIDKLVKSTDIPKSSQPSLMDFTNRYNYLTTHYDSIVSVHLNGKFSGMINSSRKAAAAVSKTSGKKIDIIDSHNATGALGLTVLRTAEAAIEGVSHEDLVVKAAEWADKTKLFVSCINTQYLISSGRLSTFKALLLKYLRIKPLFTINTEGDLKLKTFSFRSKDNFKKILGLIKENYEHKKIWNYCVMHVDNPDAAQYLSEVVEKLTGRAPLYIEDACPMLASKVGPKAVAVAIMEE